MDGQTGCLVGKVLVEADINKNDSGSSCSSDDDDSSDAPDDVCYCYIVHISSLFKIPNRGFMFRFEFEI